MKKNLSFLFVPALLLTIGLSLMWSPVAAQPQDENCMRDAAQQMAACQQAAADQTQREQCRDYFECLRNRCAAIRNGEGAKACKPPFAF